MVLEIKVPTGATHFSDLKVLSIQLITYIFSFVILSMYWNNNHNLFPNAQTVKNK